MTQAIVAFGAGAALLFVWSGMAKLARPAPAVAMLDTLRLPDWQRMPRRVAVRLVGLAELVAGLAMLAVGGRLAALALTALFASFTGVVVLSLRSGSRASCGCFGTWDAPVGRAHVGVVLAGTVIGTVLVASPGGRLGGVPELPVLAASVLAAQVLLVTALACLLLTALPPLVAARNRVLETGGRS